MTRNTKLWFLAVVIGLFSASAVFAQTEAPTGNNPVDPAADRSTEFVAVEGAQESGISGQKLLVIAYACLWLLPFAYIARIAKTQSKVAHDLAELQRQLGGNRG